jgi:hypothetical protein
MHHIRLGAVGQHYYASGEWVSVLQDCLPCENSQALFSLSHREKAGVRGLAEHRRVPLPSLSYRDRGRQPPVATPVDGEGSAWWRRRTLALVQVKSWGNNA